VLVKFSSVTSLCTRLNAVSFDYSPGDCMVWTLSVFLMTTIYKRIHWHCSLKINSPCRLRSSFITVSFFQGVMPAMKFSRHFFSGRHC